MRHMRCIVRLIDNDEVTIDIALINIQYRTDIIKTGQTSKFIGCAYSVAYIIYAAFKACSVRLVLR